MTLAGIMKLAMKQLDEAVEDISEYDELFRSYANMGYMIALRLFLKPRETFRLESDGSGRADIRALPIGRVVEVRDKQGKALAFDIEAVFLLCEVEYPAMAADTDEPNMPEYAHPALADYICYRHLSSGSLAKQSRAKFFESSFYQQMRAMKPQGAGSVTRLRHLYEATGTGYVR